MAAGDLYIFPSFARYWADGTNAHDFESTTIRLALFKASVTVAVNAGASYYASVTAKEVTAGTAYTDRGALLPSQTVTLSNSITIIKGGNISWASDASGFDAARWAILYKDTGTDATSPLIALLDLGSAQSNKSASFGVNWATGNKILKIGAAAGNVLPAV